MLADCFLTAFLTVPNADRARSFYRDVLGLPLVHEDNFALVFNANGTQLRISLYRDFHAQPFTVLGWQVEDAATLSRQLQQAGISLERFPGLTQDELGLWPAPSGYIIGWFRDPFGNLLSISQPPATPPAIPSS